MDTPHTGEHSFQLPNEYVKARLLKSTVPALLIGSILGLIITRDFGILLISLAVIAPIYLLMYLFQVISMFIFQKQELKELIFTDYQQKLVGKKMPKLN